MSAYLFVHFSMNDKHDEEAVWFSVSKDGLNWKDLGKSSPVLKSNQGTQGVRDPFIVYDNKSEKYFIIATDLDTTGQNFSWGNAVTSGSRSLLVWESKDLIHWSELRMIEVGVEHAGCVWAPEAIFCREKDSWFVFWASNVKEEGETAPKQRIYGSFTKDFLTFSPAFKYFDADTDIIDTDIVFDQGWYYRFSKDETNKNIILERSKELISTQRYERISSELLNSFFGVEGPEAFYLEEENKWCLLVDQYRSHGGYIPLLSDDLSSGIFETAPEASYDMGIRKKRHGGVIRISDEMYEQLVHFYGFYPN